MIAANISAVAIPQGASHFLAYSGNSFGEMTAPFSTLIQDMYVCGLETGLVLGVDEKPSAF